MARLGPIAASIAGALTLASAVGAVPARARAQARLDWQVPAGTDCIDGARVATAVSAMLGRDVFTSTATAERAVQGRFERTPDGGWIAVVTLLRRDGEVIGTRRVATADPACSALDEPLGLVIALLVDAPAERTVRVPPRPATPPSPAARFAVLLEGRGSSGLVGPVGAGAELTVSLEWPVRLAVELSAGATYGEPSITEGTAELLAIEATLGACGVPLRGPFRLRLCAGGRGGALRATARGFDTTSPETRPLATVSIWGRFTAELGGGLGLTLTAGAGVPLVRDRFLYADPAGTTHELYHPSPVHALLGLGLEYAPGGS